VQERLMEENKDDEIVYRYFYYYNIMKNREEHEKEMKILEQEEIAYQNHYKSTYENLRSVRKSKYKGEALTTEEMNFKPPRRLTEMAITGPSSPREMNHLKNFGAFTQRVELFPVVPIQNDSPEKARYLDRKLRVHDEKIKQLIKQQEQMVQVRIEKKREEKEQKINLA
jgi:hypothetical protein